MSVHSFFRLQFIDQFLVKSVGEGAQKNENILSIQNKDHSEYWRQKLYRFRAVLSEHSPEKPCVDNLKQK